MVSNIIDGKALAQNLLEQVRTVVNLLQVKCKLSPKFSVILVGDQEASNIYVKRKILAASSVGIIANVIRFSKDSSKDEIISTITNLNSDCNNHGIIVQSPLPQDLVFEEITQAVHSEKDVDGFHVNNAGKLVSNIEQCFVPCTALGCLGLLLFVHKEIRGKHVVIVGRSNIVGRPLASLLLNQDATVTVCHRATKNLDRVMRSGEIVVTATGTREQFDRKYFAYGSTVIDVGITRLEKRLVGDVAFDDLLGHAAHITPVPGGVGPMTVACLLINVVRSACILNNINFHHSLYDSFRIA